jgi:hypothetical protein
MNEDHVSELRENEPIESKAPQECGEGVKGEARVEASELSLDPSADPGADSGAALSGAQGSELDELRSELNLLKASLAERDARSSRVRKEYDEFRTLYPDVALNSLGDSVWNDVESGIPLAAAYALEERRRTHEAELARLCNADTKKRSAGSVQCGADGEFSPSEVRAMSPSDVRKNFSRIMRSMQKWR